MGLIRCKRNNDVLAQDLIKKLLCADPRKRLKSDQILSHPWMVGDETPRKNLPNITDKIREYNAKKKFKVITSSF